jgi:hypothetical protein
MVREFLCGLGRALTAHRTCPVKFDEPVWVRERSGPVGAQARAAQDHFSEAGELGLVTAPLPAPRVGTSTSRCSS